MEPEYVTVDEVLTRGVGLCSGYVPGTVPGEYMELYQYKRRVYAVVCYPSGAKLFPMGLCWNSFPEGDPVPDPDDVCDLSAL